MLLIYYFETATISNLVVKVQITYLINNYITFNFTPKSTKFVTEFDLSLYFRAVTSRFATDTWSSNL